MSDSLLVVRSVTHRYGERTALNNVSFQVGQGRNLRTARPERRRQNDALRILSTLVAPREGSVRMFGSTWFASRARFAGALVWFFNHQVWTVNYRARKPPPSGSSLQSFAAGLQSRIDQLLSRLG